LGRLYVKEFHEIGKLKKSLTSMCCEMWTQSMTIEEVGKNNAWTDITHSHYQHCRDRLEYRESILEKLIEKKRGFNFIV
jgi:hypothetical protein